MATAHRLNAVQMRDTFAQLRLPPIKAATMHEVQALSIPAPHGAINCRLYKPVNKENLPLLIWFHGGGWVLGDLESADMPCRDIATKSECMVLSVDYRLAPEHPFPAAYEDAMTVVQWIFENTSTLQADRQRIAIGGDSAGANLAACASVAHKDLPIAFQLLIYPVIEADFGNTSCVENADNYFLTLDLMKWFWNQYVPDHSMRTDSRVSPLAADLKQQPPAWLLTVHFDPLRDEGLKYAAALRDAGVPVESVQVNDTVHGFFTMPTVHSEKARADAATALKSALM